jgi:hypothetical protein
MLSEITGLRRRAFALIATLSKQRFPPEDPRAEVQVKLQTAANSMGAAQKALSDSSSPDGLRAEPEVRLSQEAAIVIALVGTALPHATSELEEAECWLRALRLYGVVGDALHSLGVREKPLQPDSKPAWRLGRARSASRTVDNVRGKAEDLVVERRSTLVTTLDLLFSLFLVYGGAFDRALYARGVGREKIVDRLGEIDRVRERPVA